MDENQIYKWLTLLTSRVAGLIVAARWVVLLLMAMITVASLFVFADRFYIDPGFDKSIPTDHPFTATYRQYENEVGSGNQLIFELQPKKDGDIFTSEFLEALAYATEKVRFMPGINRSTLRSLFTPNVYFVAVTKEGFRGARIVPSDFRPTPQGIKEVRKNLELSSEIGGLVAKDFSGALIVADVHETELREKGRINYRSLREEIDLLSSELEERGVRLQVVGFPQFITEIIREQNEVVKFFIFSAVAILGLVLLYVGSLAIACIVTAIALLSVVWTLGLVAMLGIGLDPLSILVPFLIFAIAISHAIQMTSAWGVGRAKGLSSAAAAREAFTALFIPGTTALLSTGLGFTAIALIDIPAIKDFAFLAGAGVLIMIVTNKFVLPAFLSVVPESNTDDAKLKKRRETALQHTLALYLPTLERVVGNRTFSILVLIIAIGIGAFGATIAGDVVIGDAGRGAPELREDSNYNKSVMSLTTRYNMATDQIGAVIVPKTTEACVAPDVVRAIDDLSWNIYLDPEVLRVKSLAFLVRSRYVGNSEGFPKFWSLPEGRADLGESLRGVEIMERYFNQDCSVIPITAYLRNHEASTLSRVVERIQSWWGNSSKGAPTFELKLATGSAGILAATNESVRRAQRQIDLTLFCGVGILCLLTFWSWKASVAVVLPLIVVALLGNVVMVHFGIGLKVATLPCVAMGVGVGVDYGIYLISRMLAYRKAGESAAESRRKAFAEVGPPVVFTAVTMTLAVATWLPSGLKFQADMGGLLAMMFFVNAVGALLVAPAVLKLIDDRF